MEMSNILVPSHTYLGPHNDFLFSFFFIDVWNILLHGDWKEGQTV